MPAMPDRQVGERRAHPVNSPEWWDDYFAHHWEANGGTLQTRHFMERLVANLPLEIIALMGRRPLKILDWGCAFGEGVDVLAHAFPGAQVIGLDLSPVAIQEAKRRHPAYEFRVKATGSVGPFDVVISSNCLEHFESPLEVLREHLRSCRSLCIVLVPYDEDPLDESHRARLTEASFPAELDGFTRLHTAVVDVDPACWHGQQLLVIYGSADCGLQAGVADGERKKWDAYYESLPEIEEAEPIRGFNEELVRLVHDLLPQGSSVLEAGAGAGLQSLALARTGRFRVHLMDFSDQALRQARSLFQREGFTAEFHRGDVFAPGTSEFDLVFNAGVLEHYTFDEQVAFVRGMASRSRKFVLVLVPNRLCYWYWIWRIQAVADGDWPYGKEVPRTDLAAVLEAAGLRPLGRVFVGETWTESLINSLGGLDAGARELILAVHRSGVVPLPQRAYLLAALASAREDATAPPLWSASPHEESLPGAEHLATVADALALRIGAEQRLKRADANLQMQAERTQALAAELAESAATRAREAEAARDEQARSAATMAALERRVVETERAAGDSQARAAASDERIVELTTQLDGATQATAVLQQRLKAAAHERHLMVTSTGWAALEFLWRIRLLVAPRGSLRERIAKLPLRALRAIRAYGVGLPGRLVERLATRFLPPPMTWAAYRFDTYKRARRTRYTAALDGFRTPAVSDLVSVVLPVYNGQAYIAEALDSVLAQTYSDLEVIVVDDGSADDTPHILDAYARRDRRITIIRQENQGLPRALSAGFRAARGEFLTWASADNRLRVDFVGRMVGCLRRRPEWDAVYANVDIIGDDGEPLRGSGWYGDYQTPRGSEHITLPSDPSELNVVANNYVGAAFMYRSRVDALLGDYSSRRFGTEDYDYWMRVNALCTLRHADFPEPVCEYRFHGDSLTSRDDELGITRSRASLMAFEDFRRDFYLTPVAWRVEGAEGAVAAGIRSWIERAGHTILAVSEERGELPTLWFPVVCVHVVEACTSSVTPRSGWPVGALRVLLVTGQGALPERVSADWDVCITTSPGASLPALARPRQGWFAAQSLDVLCTALDVRVKQEALARIEMAACAPQDERRSIAVVICTYRRHAALERALRSVAAQTFAEDRYEVIVVNNDPDDEGVVQLVGALRRDVFGGSAERLHLVQCPFTGLSHARNAGIANAKSRLLAFLDDDAVAARDWLDRLWDAWQAHPGAGVIGGTIALESPPGNRWVKPGWEKFWGHYSPRRSQPYAVSGWWEFPWGGNWAATRQALLTIGGFRCGYGRRGSDHGGGEEVVAACLIRDLGLEVVVAPAARVVHAPAANRFTLAHIRHTIAASKNTEYRKQMDLYIPMTLDGAMLRRVARMHLRTAFRERHRPRHERWEHLMYAWATLRLLPSRLRDEFGRRRHPVGMR
jgi:glycosyltransferase involved in cell wall biosynthesis/2-polyprenyl-3-methyl-5-hydroxy-6-metoxy-1,4-benzoquinol methylase